MKRPMLVAALAATCVAPLQAQTIDRARMNGAGPVAMGGFAGARFRLPLGGTRGEKRTVRAGLTVAPMQRSGGGDLRGLAWRFGEGVEFGFRSDEPQPQFSLAGQQLTPARYAPGGTTPTKGRNNLSGGTSTAVIVGLAVLVGGGLALALSSSGDPDRCTGGECNNN